MVEPINYDHKMKIKSLEKGILGNPLRDDTQKNYLY